MVRKNIFDIVSESINMENEVDRIVALAKTEKVMLRMRCNRSLLEYVDVYCFSQWKHRGHCINTEDFCKSLNYNTIVKEAKKDVNAFIILIELFYNFWFLADVQLKKDRFGYIASDNFYHLKNLMTDNLNKYNQKAFIQDGRVLIIEDKPEITAVTEIVEPEVSLDVIRYNHYSLKGEIEAKKTILLRLGSELEPKRADLEVINRQLTSDIFNLLNNLNIRHNNVNLTNKKKYREYVAKMSQDELEKWYDELYQMILLAFLLLDNIERTEKVRDLNSKIVK